MSRRTPARKLVASKEIAEENEAQNALDDKPEKKGLFSRLFKKDGKKKH